MVSTDPRTLAEAVLEFFNTVTDPYEIRHRVKDDPNFGTSLPYGITLKALAVFRSAMTKTLLHASILLTFLPVGALAQTEPWQQGAFEIRVFDVEQGDGQLIWLSPTRSCARCST